MKKTLLLFSVAMVIFLGDVLAQGSTTASMRGRITDSNGEGLPGATVRATHTPTGSEWGNVTDLNGYFRLPNMKVGGPYTVTITFVGFETIERENIFLTLGQTFNMNETLSENVTELEAIVISASQGEIIDGNRTGASTFIGKEAIEGLPTVGRSIGDFVRLTPQAQITEGNDGLSLSIGGQNNRYNAIYIDGAVSNDVFGLAGSGTNGGQTGVTPISLDAIEQFNVAIAPFDVRQSGFAGGSVSAVTRSGSNEVEGSAYFFTQNEKLAGITPQEDGEDLQELRLPDFTSQTYGFRVGGPIIKNKLFFFANAELQRDEIPQPFQFGEYIGDATQADVDRLVSHLNSLGFDPGTYTDNTTFLDSDKFLIKLDWNASDNHKVTLRHSFTEARNLEARNSSATGIRFQNGSEFFNSTTNTTALELRSSLGANMSNHLTVGATIVRDDRDPYDNSNDGPSIPFPAVFIDDGRGGFNFGSETFSTANLLDQDVITITDNFEYYKGKHTFLAGFNAEFYTVTNLFIPFNYGDYGWERDTPIGGVSNLDDFINGEPADDYIRSFSLRDNVTGDGSAAGVTFNGALFGFYLQDEYQAMDNLKLTFGIRGDIQSFDDTPENTAFNNETIPLLEAAGYDLEGARTGQFIKSQFYFSPRFGFNWDLNNDQRTQIRGGWGIFTSRIPLVWPGGAFNNNGVNRGTTLDFLLNDEALRLRDWDNQPVGVDGDGNVLTSIDPNNVSPSGDIDLFAEDFRIPQVWKANLALDQKIGSTGLIATVEGLFTKTINQVYYQNVNLGRTPEGFLEGTPDDRPIWNRRAPVDGTYGRIMFGTNNSDGYAYNVSATLTKPMENGLAASLSYSYGDAFSIYDGTSSQNSSQWRGLFTVDGRNDFTDVTRSDFSQASRIIGSVTYRKEYAGFMGTQVTLFYEGRSGTPYSYIYGRGQNIQNEDSRNRALVYIPANQSEIVLVDTDDYTAAQQWDLLNSFIEDDPYLSENRGQYAERNQNRTPFENVIDLKILQDFYMETGNGKRNTLQFSLDIFNFTNFISSSLGKRYSRRSFGVELLEFEGFQDGTNIPTYSFEPFNDIEPNEALYGQFDDAGLFSARWRMQFGIRYIFN